MEGKELDKKDDELESGSPEENIEESDDFGLPDASSDSESTTDEDSEPLDFSSETETDSDSDSYFGESDDDHSTVETGGYQYHSDRDDKRSPVGLIISMILIGVIVVAIAIYWFFFREPPQRVVEQPVAVKVEEPVVVEEPPVVVVEEEPPAIEEPIEEPGEEGLVQTINAPTGRYYIVINSFFDGDLAVDYANKLAVDGFDSKILAPSDKKSFSRVVINEEFGSWQEAEANKAQFTEIFGEDIWVLKY